MRRMSWLVVLWAATLAHAEDQQLNVFGKVVAVPDATSIWVYIEDARASFHFCLAGVCNPPADSLQAQTARETLAKLVLGREVRLQVDRLSLEGMTPAQVCVDTQLINDQIAAVTASPGCVASCPAKPSPSAAVYEYPPRRPIVNLWLRLVSAFRCPVVRPL